MTNQLPESVETRWVAVFIAAAVSLTVIASVFSTAQYVNGQKDPIIAGLEDEIRRKDDRIISLENQGKRSIEDDVSLLLDLMNKLAKASDSKAVATGLAAFSTMRKIFTGLSEIRDLQEHYDCLCLNTTVQIAFQVNETVQLHYNETCAGYEVVLGRDPAQFADYLKAINTILLALVNLDNAISADP